MKMYMITLKMFYKKLGYMLKNINFVASHVFRVHNVFLCHFQIQPLVKLDAIMMLLIGCHVRICNATYLSVKSPLLKSCLLKMVNG